MLEVPTNNVLTRVLLTRASGQQFTSFVMSLDGQAYVVSAAHGFNGKFDRLECHFRKDIGWANLRVSHIASSEQYDFAVHLLHEPDNFFPLPIMASPYYLGQNAFFAGFPALQNLPYMWLPDDGRPIPMLRKGVIAWSKDHRLMLDARSLHGFSGAPVVIKPHSTGDWNVIGIVTDYIATKEKVGITEYHNEYDMFVNSGYTSCTDITKIVQTIRDEVARGGS